MGVAPSISNTFSSPPILLCCFYRQSCPLLAHISFHFFFLISGRSSVRNAPVLTDSQILSFTLSRSFARCFIDSFPSAFVLFEPVFLFCFGEVEKHRSSVLKNLIDLWRLKEGFSGWSGVLTTLNGRASFKLGSSTGYCFFILCTPCLKPV